MRSTIILVILFASACSEISTGRINTAKEIEKKEVFEQWETFKNDFVKQKKMTNEETAVQFAPSTIEEAFKKLEENIHPDDIKFIKNSDETIIDSPEMISVVKIINSWGLWNKSKISLYLYSRGFSDYYAMSKIITKLFVKYLQGKKWKLEIEKNYPEHFEIADLLIEENNEKIGEIIKNKLVMPEKGELPSIMDIVLVSCNGNSYKLLKKYFPDMDSVGKMYYCNEDFFLEIIEHNKNLLKNSDFIKTISAKNGVLSKYCNDIETFDEQTDRAIFDSVLFYGNDEDFLCAKGKYDFNPEIKIQHFTGNFFSGEKEKYILENSPHDLFEDRNVTLSIAAFLAKKEPERIRKFITIASLTPEEIGSYHVTGSLLSRTDTAFFDILFENGISPHYITLLTQHTILDIAISECNPVAIDYLLEKGADPNYRVANRFSPVLNLLYYTGDPSVCKPDVVIKYLILRGMSVKGTGGETLPVSRLTQAGSLDLLMFMEKYGYDFSYESNKASEPLAESVLNKDKAVFDWLVKIQGYNLNQQNQDGNTILHEFVNQQDFKSVKFLVNKGINTAIKNKNGQTALDLAKEILSGDSEVKDKTPGDLKSFDFNNPTIKVLNQIIDFLEKNTPEVS